MRVFSSPCHLRRGRVLFNVFFVEIVLLHPIRAREFYASVGKRLVALREIFIDIAFFVQDEIRRFGGAPIELAHPAQDCVHRLLGVSGAR